MKTILKLVLVFFVSLNIQAQNGIEKHTFNTKDLNSNQLTQFFSNKIENTQFIMLGEQHGIREVGEITNTLYNLAKPKGYNALCIEVSPFAASILDLQFSASKNPEEGLQKLYKEYPFSIPFYNNKNDVELFKNVMKQNGEIWGIDQVFMVEFRLVFDYLINLNNNNALKEAVKPLLKEAKLGFEKAVKEKNMKAPFIFNYSDELHNKLLKLTETEEEKKLLKDLKLTKEIYMYYFQRKNYLNNNERAKLMKRNFLNYYDKASEVGKIPKVLFKLGANHVGKGLTRTNVFDISNLVSELAFINNKKSLHVFAMGVDGTKNLGNPFAPVSIVPFNNAKELPKEVLEVVKTQKNKYLIIDAEALRSKAKNLSKQMKDLVFKYDVLIYIKNCNALENLNTHK